VRRPQGPDERLRVGTVLSRTGTLARVQWNDDGVVEENVRLGGENLLAVAYRWATSEEILLHKALVEQVRA
jgi:hypothetical protein